jgi:hypothetical protein
MLSLPRLDMISRLKQSSHSILLSRWTTGVYHHALLACFLEEFYFLKKVWVGWVQWLISIIPATQGTEIERIKV